MEVTIFCDFPTEVTSHHLCWLLLGRWESTPAHSHRGKLTPRHDYRVGGRVLGAILKSAFHMEGDIKDTSKQISEQQNSRVVRKVTGVQCLMMGGYQLHEDADRSLLLRTTRSLPGARHRGPERMQLLSA